MHVDDWDERFLSQIDSKTYVEMLKLGNVKLAMVSASSHVGKCSYPTRVGQMHKGIKGRDVLGEIIDLAHKAGIFWTLRSPAPLNPECSEVLGSPCLSYANSAMHHRRLYFW